MSPRAFAWGLGLATAATFALGLVRFEGPCHGYWDTYITAPAMFMNGAPIDFVLKDGSPAWTYALSGALPDDLVSKASYGIITKDQRMGSGILAAPYFAAFGMLGFRVLFALSLAMLVPLTALVVRTLRPDATLSALTAGLAFAWNPFVLSIERLNPNLLVLPLVLLLLREALLPTGRAWLVGGLLGVIGGMREEAVCFVPALAAWWLFRPEARADPFVRRFTSLVVLGVATLVAMLPIFHWKWFAFGDPLLHPSQYAHYDGFRPEFVHHMPLTGAEFRFNGLFNWPFHDTLVRTPHFAFPTYLLFPLVTLRALGLLGAAITALGLGRLWFTQRATALLFIGWGLPLFALFGPQENWEEVKMTFMLLAWPPLMACLGVGLRDLGERGPWLMRRVVAVGSVALVLFAGTRLVAQWHVPVDERWYVRFPNASAELNPAVQIGLPESDRNAWVYFQSRETDEEIARERSKLTAALPWPARYLPLRTDWSAAWTAMRTEAGERRLTVLDIWGYIYGTRK